LKPLPRRIVIGTRETPRACYGAAMTRASLIRIGLGLLPVLALGACVGDVARYPSLARRPAERIGGSVAPTPTEPAPAPAGPVDAAVAARVSQLLDSARTAQRDFADKRPAAERAVAGGSTFGSEAWASASTGLAQLETAHGGAVQALAQLDQMEVDQRVVAAGAETPEIAAIVSARDEVSKIVEDQSEVLTRLRGRVAN
jgi:hypothetical protein